MKTIWLTQFEPYKSNPAFIPLNAFSFVEQDAYEVPTVVEANRFLEKLKMRFGHLPWEIIDSNAGYKLKAKVK